MILVKNYLQKGEPNLAWDNVRSLQIEYPNRPEVLNMVGLTHLALQNNGKAKQVFSKAYQLSRKAAYGLNLSSAMIALGATNRARRLLRGIIRKENSYRHRERLMHNLALTYEKESKWNQAIKYYREAIATNPNFLLAMLNLSKIYKKMDKPVRVVQTLQKAVQVCPSCLEPVNELATVFINQGKLGKAISRLEKFLASKKASSGDKADARNLLAMAKRIKARRANRSRKKLKQM